MALLPSAVQMVCAGLSLKRKRVCACLQAPLHLLPGQQLVAPWACRHYHLEQCHHHRGRWRRYVLACPSCAACAHGFCLPMFRLLPCIW